MSKETCGLLTALAELNRDISKMMLDVLDGSLSATDEIRFGESLVKGGQSLIAGRLVLQLRDA